MTAELLLRLIREGEKDEEDNQVLIEPEVIVRESTREKREGI